jgi:hypothetical protein
MGDESPHPTSEGGTMNERLWDLYEQLCMVELVSLDEFVRRVKTGEFGEFPTDTMVSFLREIEANMLQNIQVKTMEHQVYADMADQVSEDTHKMFDELIEELRRS